MPNLPVIRRWVEALRSGKYRQATGAMRQSVESGYGYCCLGVLCEVYTAETGQVVEYEDEHFNEALPSDVRKWAGLDSQNPTISKGIVATRANDGLKWDFSKIADEIEKHYLAGEGK